MINWSILSRIKAKQKFVPAKSTKSGPDKSKIGIVMKDPDSGKVVKEFESVEKAVEEGFSKPHLAGALKNGNKYKGHIWAEA